MCNYFLNFILIMSMVMLLMACSENSSSQKFKKYIGSLRKDISVKKIKSSALELNITPPVPVRYTVIPSKDPFAIGEIPAPKKSGGNNSNPLLIYPVTMLKFLGTMFYNGNSFAYVLTPDHKLRQVKTGNLIGDHNGKVTDISYDRIEVTEYDVEAGKPSVPHKIILKLKDINR